MAESIFDNLTSPAFTTAVPLSAAVMPTGDAPAGAGKASRRAAAKAFKARLRRSAQLRTAADALPHLPGPG